MAQKINLRESVILFRLLKSYYVCVGFLYFAFFVRLLVLLPLVGRKFLPGGIHTFFEQVTYITFGLGLLLSCVQLVPIAPLQYILGNFLNVVVVWILSKDIKLQRHAVYGLYIGDVAVTGIVAYVYHFQKLVYIGHTPAATRGFYQAISLADLVLRGLLEFVILFMGLKYVEGPYKTALSVVIFFHIPTKFFLLKRLWTKQSSGDQVKVE